MLIWFDLTLVNGCVDRKLSISFRFFKLGGVQVLTVQPYRSLDFLVSCYVPFSFLLSLIWTFFPLPFSLSFLLVFFFPRRTKSLCHWFFELLWIVCLFLFCWLLVCFYLIKACIWFAVATCSFWVWFLLFVLERSGALLYY